MVAIKPAKKKASASLDPAELVEEIATPRKSKEVMGSFKSPAGRRSARLAKH